jgi:HEAT repeat protein
MHTPLVPLLAAALALAAPPPTQTSTLRSPGDSAITEVGGKTFRQWADDLKNPDASVREEAIRALVMFRRDAQRAVPLIVDRLEDRDASPRVKAAIALGMIEIPKDEVPRVTRALGQRLLQDSQSIVRYYAATALVNFAEDARYGQAGLVKGVSDPATWEIRHACVSALRTAGRDAGGGPSPDVEYALINALHDPTYRVRLEAILAIGSLGRPADRTLFARVIQALTDRIADRDPAVKIWAYVALMVIDEVTEKSLHPVVKYLKHNDPKVRVEAARGLGAMGNKIKGKWVAEVEPALLATLDDNEPTVVGNAARALLEIEELSAAGRSTLLGLLRSPDVDVRAAVAQAFGSAGTRGRSAVPALAALVQDRRQPPYVVSMACWALGEIGEPSPDALAALNGVIQREDTDKSLKNWAQDALAQINKLKR